MEEDAYMQISNFGTVMEGIKEAKRGNTSLGLQLLTDSVANARLPEAKAWQGYCLAIEKNNFQHGISLCHEARQLQPKNSEIYLALGRIYLLAERRAEAVKALLHGLKLDHNREIDRLLESIGMRKPTLFRFLSRNNKINIVSGRLFSRIGLR
jgi:tetratricopeptide (TPR) repeat protein